MRARRRWGPAGLAGMGLLIGLAGCPDPIANPGTSSTTGSGSGSTTTSSTTTTTTTGAGGAGGTGGAGTGGNPGPTVVMGAFVSGAVQPGSGAVRVRGQLVWHARVSEGNGAVRVKGWLR